MRSLEIRLDHAKSGEALEVLLDLAVIIYASESFVDLIKEGRALERIRSFPTINPHTVIENEPIHKIFVPGSREDESRRIEAPGLDSRDDPVFKNVHMRHIQAL